MKAPAHKPLKLTAAGFCRAGGRARIGAWEDHPRPQLIQIHLNYSNVTGLRMVRRENPFQSRHSPRYLIAIAHRIAYRPGGPDHVFNLSAPPCIAGPAGFGALFPPSAPAGMQVGGWCYISSLANGPS